MSWGLRKRWRGSPRILRREVATTPRRRRLTGVELEPDTLPATDIQAESDGQPHPDSLPEAGHPEARHPEPSVKRRVAMMLGFVIVSVVLLTLAAGGVAAV